MCLLLRVVAVAETREPAARNGLAVGAGYMKTRGSRHPCHFAFQAESRLPRETRRKVNDSKSGTERKPR